MARRTATRTVKPMPAGAGRGVSAIVLAAGSSTRMGGAKPVARLAGRPLLAHSLDALRASGVGEIVVVLGAQADRIRRDVPLEGAHVVTNARHAEGMSSSIRAGMRAASPGADGFLIVLGDQPLVAPATINAMLRAHGAAHAHVVVPTFRGIRGNPVLFDRSLSRDIEAIRGDVGCREVVRAHAAEVLEVPVEDPGILLDVDTPQDLERIEAALREGSPLERLLRG